ncbi:Argininosuccinate lyase [Mycena sanguinolenta]|uniref:argininosuccinate lyase n=1 Tax=Mycena sanguinolenta TaxID=230812 RepID=A0A8H7D966_9AGAR|nr:Argininosuccinate lyase [Mycena sanguinolenta]
MHAFNQSLKYDQRMHAADIKGSIAYAKSLTLVGILTKEEEAKITAGLIAVGKEWQDGVVKEDDEDIHTANERRLSELIGPLGGKLHTGRSRNDQVATDMRLWLLEEVKDLEQSVKGLLQEKDILLPGYTHLQRGQPIRWSHLLLSHATSFRYDLERLQQLVPRISILPLGSGALAGNPFAVDREFLAKELGFASIAENSMWGVGDRDFIVEFLMWSSLTMTHISRMAEDLIMAGFVMTLKGLPSTYNKDLQEDKEPLFDSVDNISASLKIAEGVIATMDVHADKMFKALTMDVLATDLADYLVRKGIPFRETHHISGRAVALAEARKCQLNELSLADFKSLNENFSQDIHSVFNFEASVERRESIGGTSKKMVERQVSVLREVLRK